MFVPGQVGSPVSQTDVFSLSVALTEMALFCVCGAQPEDFPLPACRSLALSPSRRGGAPGLWGKVGLEPGARASRRRLQGGGQRQKEEAETVPAG